MHGYCYYWLGMYASFFRKLRHPNIITLMGVCYNVSQLLLVTNYINGRNLEQIIFSDSWNVSKTCMACTPNKQFYFQLDAPKRISICVQIAKALAYMHCRDPVIIHQDIKPANIMVKHKHCMRAYKVKWIISQVTSSDLHVFVCDLGVAKLQNKLAINKTSKVLSAGTVAYQAPEMFRASRRSTPVDIYSFGCIIIELFTGKSYLSLHLAAFLHWVFSGKRVWGELDAFQIIGKIVGTREDEPQSPSCKKVAKEHRQICAHSTALDASNRPSALEILEYFKLQWGVTSACMMICIYDMKYC